MYHSVGVSRCSPTQKTKLKKGGAVRMKLGSAHSLPLRKDQIKKLERAHKKGGSVTIMLDPYQIDELHGRGFFDSLKKVASHPITKSISRAVRPIARDAIKSMIPQEGIMGTLGHATVDLLDREAEKAGYGRKKKYVHHDKRLLNGQIIEPEELGMSVDEFDRLHGRGFFDSLKKVASHPITKSISRAVRPVARDAIKSMIPQEGIMGTLGHATVDLLDREAEKAGYGRKKKYVHHDKRLLNGHIIEPEALGMSVDEFDRLRGRGFFDSLKKAASHPITKSISRAVRPMARDMVKSMIPQEGIMGTLGHATVDLLDREAEKAGYGRRRKKGGALIAAGY